MLLRGLASDHVDPSEVGRSMLRLLGDYVARLLAFRASGASRPWIDLRFRDFVADPLRAVALVYERAGIPLGDEARAGMAAWVDAHPRDDTGRARPAELDPYGIDPDEARAVFAPYCDAFGVESDGI